MTEYIIAVVVLVFLAALYLFFRWLDQRTWLSRTVDGMADQLFELSFKFFVAGKHEEFTKICRIIAQLVVLAEIGDQRLRRQLDKAKWIQLKAMPDQLKHRLETFAATDRYNQAVTTELEKRLHGILSVVWPGELDKLANAFSQSSGHVRSLERYRQACRADTLIERLAKCCHLRPVRETREVDTDDLRSLMPGTQLLVNGKLCLVTSRRRFTVSGRVAWEEFELYSYLTGGFMHLSCILDQQSYWLRLATEPRAPEYLRITDSLNLPQEVREDAEIAGPWIETDYLGYEVFSRAQSIAAVMEEGSRREPVLRVRWSSGKRHITATYAGSRVVASLEEEIPLEWLRLVTPRFTIE